MDDWDIPYLDKVREMIASGPEPAIAYVFDPEFVAAIGGYPEGAILASSKVKGDLWLCLKDGNMGDPDAGAPHWQLSRGT